MRVLSLFDGISCAMVALERAGIPVEKYTAYEIEPNAIKISKKNYPQIEQCGDVMTADFDAMRGGTTCYVAGVHAPIGHLLNALRQQNRKRTQILSKVLVGHCL